MDFTIFIIVLGALQLLCTYVTSRSNKQMTSQEDYFLASKGVGSFPLIMTFVATQIGGGMISGADEAYRYGWSAFLYPLGQSLGFVLLACGIGKRLAGFQVSTVAQLLEIAYHSKRLKQIASLLSIVSLFMILAAQLMASQKFLWSLGFARIDLFLGFWAIVILYTITRGLQGIILVDIIQATFFTGVFAGCVFFFSGGTSVGEVMAPVASFDISSEKLTGWLLMPLLFMAIEQDMAQRCFAAKSPSIVTRASAWSALLTLILGGIPVLFGIIGKMKGVQVAQGQGAMMLIAQELMPAWLSALVGCAILMVIVSTAVSLLNAISSNVMQDFALKGGVKQSRWITALIAVCALGFSFFFNNVVDILIQSYELSISCFFVAVIAAICGKGGDKKAAYLSVLFGMIGFVAFRFISIGIPREIASLILSLSGYYVGLLWAAYVPQKALITE